MTPVIYKYPIAITDRQIVAIHRTCRAGGETPCLWVEVNPDSPKEAAEVLVIGTGNPMSSLRGNHLGTFVMEPFVWHVYSPHLRRAGQ